jgi:hypothetical protein
MVHHKDCPSLHSKGSCICLDWDPVLDPPTGFVRALPLVCAICKARFDPEQRCLCVDRPVEPIED